ncbi:MAG TPA: hypothetical protein VE010_23375 [Thermoanaerobaculia bacterium]|nr:hypothetical protein [Thermoanaerobaculia bacterium]
MPEELYFAGRDELGRDVHLAFVRELSDVGALVLPQTFVILIGGATADLPVDVIYSAAEALLEKGAAYVMCWGEGASRLEDIVDEAVAMRGMRDPAAKTVMTTAHEDERLGDVLEFATTVAVPAEELPKEGRDVVLLFHGNVSWYNEAHNALEDLLKNTS